LPHVTAPLQKEAMLGFYRQKTVSAGHEVYTGKKQKEGRG